MSLSQSGNEVQGTVDVSALLFVVPAAGTVSGDTLTLTGQVNLQGGSGTLTIRDWSTTRSGNAMNGGFTFVVVASSPAFGSQSVSFTLQNVTKTS